MASQPFALAAQLRRGLRVGLDLVTLGISVATLLGWLSWSWYLGELASHFRVQYLWLAIACALGLAACRFWRDAALATLPALLNLAVILPLYWPSGAVPSSAAPRLRVASINVYSRNPHHAEVLDFIRHSDPDVVLLIEVTNGWRDMLEPLGAGYPFQKLELVGDNFGIALFSRVPWEDATVERLGTARLPSIVAHLKWQGAPVTLVGTHPLPPGSEGMWQSRNDQFAALADYCRRQAGPVILLGDLNSTSWSAHFDTLLEGTRLRDSRQGFGVQASWRNWLPLSMIAIDHCLVSPEIAVLDRQIGADVGSDHYPVVVDLAIAPAAQKPEEKAANRP